MVKVKQTLSLLGIFYEITIFSANASKYITINTANNRRYELLSEYCIVAYRRHYFEFQVKAKNDAHVALMTDDVSKRPGQYYYEIVIGGWGNRKSCLRSKGQGHCLVTVQKTVLSQYNFKTFWIAWENGFIKVGEGAKADDVILMQFNHSTPYVVNYIAVMTGWGSTGVWRLVDDAVCALEYFINTFIVSNQTHCNGITTYKCISGYQLTNGSLNRTCKSGYIWDGNPPVCTKKDCACCKKESSLKVERKSTSSYKRSKISATDDRVSSMIIGISLAYGLLSTLLVLMVLKDLPILLNHVVYGP